MTQSETISLPNPPSSNLIERISVRLGGSKAKEVERFIKFTVVGVIGTIVDLGLTFILIKIVFQNTADQNLINLSTGIGFCTAVTSNFILNRYWTYPDSRSRHILHQLVLFFAINTVGLGIRELIVRIFNRPLADLIIPILHLSDHDAMQTGAFGAIIMSIGIVMLWNFFVNRYWTYNDVK